jgi:hypothetical protein
VNRLNPARRNPEPSAPAAAAFDNRDVEIAVLESVGGGFAVGKIVAGTLGTLDAQGRFLVDTAYMPISPVMMYVFGQPIPVDGEATRVTRHTVKAGDVNAIRANLMQASAANWAKLYENLAGFAGLNSTVLENEKSLSLGKVDDHVRSLGLIDHDVAVIAKCQVHVDETGTIKANEGLGEIVSLQIDPTAPAVIAQSAQTEAAEGAEAGQGEAEQVTGLAMGLHEAVIAGAMSVMSSDPGQADRIKGVIAESLLRNNLLLQSGLTLRNPQIQNVTCIEQNETDDLDDEDYPVDR